MYFFHTDTDFKFKWIGDYDGDRGIRLYGYYVYYDYLHIDPADDGGFDFNCLVDEPCLKIWNSNNELVNSLNQYIVTKGNKKTHIAFGFLVRDEKSLLYIFNDYGLQRNKFQPEYRYVDPDRWRNYGLYTNFECGKFKFIKKKTKKK